MGRQYQHIVSLVGDNPLPIYLGIRQFAPPGATCTLVYTDRTHLLADHIRAALPDRKFVMEPLSGPYDPGAVSRVLGACQGPAVALNFTGGTSVMSAFGVLTWRTHPIDTFYLEGDRGLFHFGNRDTERLEPDLVGVRQVIALHGLKISPPADSIGLEPLGEAGSPQAPPATMQLLRELFQACRGDRLSFSALANDDDTFVPADERAFTWYNRKRDEVIAILRGIRAPPASDWASLLTLVDRVGYRSSSQRLVFEYIAGGRWFEDCVRVAICCLPQDRRARYQFGRLPDAPLVDRANLLVRPLMAIKNEIIECELVTVLDNRLRYVSTTVTAGEEAWQGRAFEALARAKQMGGDLACCCLATLAGEGAVERVGRRVNDEEAFTIYGLDHAASWILEDNARSLRSFLMLGFS